MNMEFTITRDGEDIVLDVEYTRSGYGIDFAVSGDIEITTDEADNLYAAIIEYEGGE